MLAVLIIVIVIGIPGGLLLEYSQCKTCHDEEYIDDSWRPTKEEVMESDPCMDEPRPSC